MYRRKVVVHTRSIWRMQYKLNLSSALRRYKHDTSALLAFSPSSILYPINNHPAYQISTALGYTDTDNVNIIPTSPSHAYNTYKPRPLPIWTIVPSYMASILSGIKQFVAILQLSIRPTYLTMPFKIINYSPFSLPSSLISLMLLRCRALLPDPNCCRYPGSLAATTVLRRSSDYAHLLGPFAFSTPCPCD